GGHAMTRRKTDGERISDRLFGLALDNQEPKLLVTREETNP
ncbi:MAG: hypothetical protein RLY63_65, partial [Chloroflexota bacterium]